MFCGDVNNSYITPTHNYYAESRYFSEGLSTTWVDISDLGLFTA